LALGADGQPIVVGETSSSDFPTAPGALQPQAQGSTDGFILRLDAQGQGMISGSYLGGALADQITALELDVGGDLWVTGNTDSQNLPVSPDAFMGTRAGGTDAFLHRLDGLATQLLYGSYLGGTAEDRGNALTIDPSGRVLVAGSTLSADFPTISGSYDRTANGGRDAFVTGFAPSQAMPVLSSFLGGLSTDEPFAITADSEGRVLVAGETSSADFPTTADALDRIYGGNIDAWVTRFDSGVSQLSWSSFMGGSLADGIWEITVDEADNPVSSGPSRSPEMPTTSGAYDPTHNGTQDVHVSRLALGVPAAVGTIVLPGPWSASPNPSRGAVTLNFDLDRPISGPLSVHDAAGRRVARLGGSRWAAGAHRVVWDGTSGQGRLAPTGVYWFRFEGDAAQAGTKVILLR
ncbi:MAG: SBBP repeat-containing protein, partial [Candidatus Eisenbacteria bacterium]|nr:SBBP repeat-containing protein [Candidatus Eisenbacteria bacterium]